MFPLRLIILLAIIVFILILFIRRIIPIYWLGILVLLFFIFITSFKSKYPQLYYLLFMPTDFHTPVVYDDFNFHEDGFTKTYNLKPKYNTFHVVGFVIDKGITSKYRFNGELEIAFFKGDKFLCNKISDHWIIAIYMDNEMKKYKDIELVRFEFPILRKYSKDIKIKIKVLKGDKQLEPLKDNIKLYISASSMK